jgi:hypothetical protein
MFKKHNLLNRKTLFNGFIYIVILLTRYLLPFSIINRYRLFKYKKVVILGSGPSLCNVKSFDDDSFLLVAINGAVYSPLFKNYTGSKFCFTADGSRAEEIFDYCKNNGFKIVISTHTLYHLRFMRFASFKTGVFFLPALKLNSFRLKFKSNNVEHFKEVGFFPTACGFGSLSHFLQFVDQFVTKEIQLFGFDFSEDNGKYFNGSPDFMNRSVNNLNQSKADYLVIRELLSYRGIKLYDGL